MTNEFEDGFAKMRTDAGEFVVPETHRAAVLEGLEQAERGEFVSEDEMATLWKKCGL